MAYLPDEELIPPCPRCGDKRHTQFIVRGKPARPPSAADLERVRFLGCVIDEDSPTGTWWCPACNSSFPWSYPFDRTLVVEEPWVSLLLDGKKVWELRRSRSNIRGRVGLTPRGSGLIAGRAFMVQSHGPFTAAELRSHRDLHLVDDDLLDQYAADEPLWAWELRAVHRYESPARYEHPRGAVIWAKLPLGPITHCEFCDREYPSADPYHILCPEFPTGWDEP